MPSDLLPQNQRLLAALVRHGQTLDNDQHILRAWHDAHLNSEGQVDAYAAAKQLAPYNPKMVYSSDLTRDTQTANIIADYFAVASEPDYGLRTADMGEWTEQPEDAVIDGERDWYQTPWKRAPSGESYNSFCKRLFTCIDAKLELAKVKVFNPIVMVCHGRCFAALESRWTGTQPWLAHMPPPGGIALIRDNGYDFPPYTLEFISEMRPILADK